MARGSIGAANGNTGNFPPEIEKKCYRKMMLFPKDLFLATTFAKIDKKFLSKNFRIF